MLRSPSSVAAFGTRRIAHFPASPARPRFFWDFVTPQRVAVHRSFRASGGGGSVKGRHASEPGRCQLLLSRRPKLGWRRALQVVTICLSQTASCTGCMLALAATAARCRSLASAAWMEDATPAGLAVPHDRASAVVCLCWLVPAVRSVPGARPKDGVDARCGAQAGGHPFGSVHWWQSHTLYA